MIKIEEAYNFGMLIFLDKYLAGHKGYACGGCFKNIFNGEKPKDIDVFFASPEEFENARMCMKKSFKEMYETKKVVAFRDEEENMTIELCRTIFGTPKEILDRFDFTITKFSYFISENEAGEKTSKVAYEEKFFEHLHLKRTVIDEQIPFPASTFERIIRYAKYGYVPCYETKKKLIEAIRASKDEELSKSLYDGMD